MILNRCASNIVSIRPAHVAASPLADIRTTCVKDVVMSHTTVGPAVVALERARTYTAPMPTHARLAAGLEARRPLRRRVASIIHRPRKKNRVAQRKARVSACPTLPETRGIVNQEARRSKTQIHATLLQAAIGGRAIWQAVGRWSLNRSWASVMESVLAQTAPSYFMPI